MQNIVTLPVQVSRIDEGRGHRTAAASGDRPASSRARELLAMLAALVAVAGVGALMVLHPIGTLKAGAPTVASDVTRLNNPS